MPEGQERIATMSREVMYDDNSGPRVQVQYDSKFELGQDKERYVAVDACGTSYIQIADIPFVIAALQEAARLDELVS